MDIFEKKTYACAVNLPGGKRETAEFYVKNFFIK